MKNTIKITAAISAALISSTAFGVTGLDRSVLTPSIMFETGNYAEVALYRSKTDVTSTLAPDSDISEDVNTVRLGYKHQVSDKFALGLMVNTQPIGVDVNYNSLGSPLRGSVSANSYTALGLYKATDSISAFGGIKYQTQRGNADLTLLGAPGPTTFGEESDTGYVLGAAYSIPKIGLRASFTYESDLEFDHDTTITGTDIRIGNTKSATPKSYLLELQSGIAKDTLLFGSIRRANWSDSQVIFLTDVQPAQLSTFEDTTAYKLGIGRKFSDSISASITLNYEKSTGNPSSPFSPQDGEKGIAIGAKFTAKDGLKTTIGIQYRKLGDTVTTASLPFEDNDVITVGLKFSKNF